ncbi:MAG TPA: hypothetical protein VGO55_03145 [Allosphingosinicella sp.]|nr:hypothetical protein [Allosphingosinicella sp.]
MRGNLADLAATGLASEPTLRKWIAAEPDQPWIIKRGSNGDAYEIQLEEAAAAFRAREDAKAQEARQRADQIKQLGLDLGLGGDEDGPVGLSIAERKQLLEEELVAIRIAKERRELVPRASVEAAFGDVLVRFRQRGTTFAARLAKKVDLTREQITAIDRLALADQAELARMMENLGKDLGDVGGEQSVDAGAAAPGAGHPAAAVEHSAV